MKKMGKETLTEQMKKRKLLIPSRVDALGGPEAGAAKQQGNGHFNEFKAQKINFTMSADGVDN